MTHPRWIGRALAAIALLHCVYGAVHWRAPLAAMLADGLWNSLGDDPARLAGFWFQVAGWILFLVAALADATERRGDGLPPAFTWGLLASAIVGCVVFPRSAYWLVLAVAVGALVGDRATPTVAERRRAAP